MLGLYLVGALDLDGHFRISEEIEGIKWDHSCKRESLSEDEIEALKKVSFKVLEVKRAVELAVGRQVLLEFHNPEDWVQGPSSSLKRGGGGAWDIQEERADLPYPVRKHHEPESTSAD